MSDEDLFAYDRVHYPAQAYRVTRPDHLELIGHLFGLAPRPADEARVLEIGCGTGENLILAGECFPRAELIGIDLAASQIDVGRQLIEATGVGNVELRAFDLARIDESFGRFDYIVAHGVYSWVPVPVREALLRVIRERLAPAGLAFVSQNVYPGYAGKAMTRGILRFGCRGIVEPDERVAAAHELLSEVLARANPSERIYRANLADRLEQIEKRERDVLYHDDLSEICDGCWFWELAERLEANGLQFVADANVENLGSTGLSAEAFADVERRARTVVEREQHLDFLRNRSFRMTVVCGAAAALDRTLAPAKLVGLHVGLDAGVEEIQMSPTAPEAPLMIRTQAARLRVEDPLTKAALVTLGRVWPGTMPFALAAERTLASIGVGPIAAGSAPPIAGPPAEAATAAALDVATRLLDLFKSGFVDISMRPPTFATVVPERPRGASLARLQAQSSGEVVNLRHTYSRVDDDCRVLLQALDGKKDRPALAAELGLEPEALDKLLGRLARLALLVA